MPDSTSIAGLKSAAEGCRGCALWRDTTQTVFSAGPRKATLMLVGEQPGDAEDRAGAPFVGPAGHVLDEALAAAGINRESLYLTNAVKHFRHVQRGKRRIHQKPAVRHIVACQPWLVAEVASVRPHVVVAMGSVAARAVLGHPVTISDVRGHLLDDEPGAVCPQSAVLVTTHPSAILRLRGSGDGSRARDAMSALVDDLRVAAGVQRRSG